MSAAPSFRAVRWSRTINLLAQAVLLVTLCAGLNFLAGRSGWRLDLTAARRNTLSPETLVRLRGLSQEVKIYCTFEDDAENPALAQARRDLTGLLDAYVGATRQNPAGQITYKFLNVHKNPREARELKLEDQPDSLVVICGERRHTVGLEELYRIEGREIQAFLGEQALTAAILDVINKERKKIYFLTGHGEPLEPPDLFQPEKGLATLVDQLRARAFDTDTLDLRNVQTLKVPNDAELVVIAGPTSPLTTSEVNTLREYLKVRAGRVLALLGPGVKHGLDDLLDDWGILTDDVFVCDDGPTGQNQNDSGDLILTAAAKSEHPAVRALSANSIPVRFGAVRPARLDPGRRNDPGLVISELIGTSPNAWGERNYLQSGTKRVVFNKGTDLPGPFAIATASERVSTGGRQPVPGGRLLVVGGSDWAANTRMTVGGNVTFALAAVNWAADRNAALALGDIPARPVARVQLSLTQAQLQRFRSILVLALPGAAALLGLAVFWARRR